MTEGIGELLGVVDGKEEESAVVVESAFQDDGVPKGFSPKEIPEL
jgi:hypothetical protein